MTTINVPKKLAIFYAYPSTINGANGNLTLAATAFSAYDVVVLGAGLESTSHPDHAKMVTILSNPLVANTKFYGYIDSTTSVSVFKNNVNLWKGSSPQIKGIFADKFGYDYGVTRATQNTLVNFIHSKNLSAFVDAWNVDDVFGFIISPTHNPNGAACAMNNTDIYLAQSYQIIDGTYQATIDWKTKADKMASYKGGFGTKMACVTTWNSDSHTFDQSMMDYAYFSTVLYNFDYFGWGEYNFSATSANMPFRTRKPFIGTKFIAPIQVLAPIYERSTNVGIKLNVVAHTTDVITI